MFKSDVLHPLDTAQDVAACDGAQKRLSFALEVLSPRTKEMGSF